MQIGAVIAEYNPFHKGHQWQLEQIKKQGISHVAVIMTRILPSGEHQLSFQSGCVLRLLYKMEQI